MISPGAAAKLTSETAARAIAPNRFQSLSTERAVAMAELPS
jgi:hypothetical protein